jgi:hypothetical protein
MPVLIIDAGGKAATEFARPGVELSNPEIPMPKSLLVAAEEPAFAVVRVEIEEVRRSCSAVPVAEDQSAEKTEESRLAVEEDTEPLHPAENPAMEAFLVPRAASPPHSACAGGGTVRGLGWADSGIPRPPFINIAPVFPPAVAPLFEDMEFELMLPFLAMEVVVELEMLHSADIEATDPRFPASLPHGAKRAVFSLCFEMIAVVGGPAVFNPPETEKEPPILVVATVAGFGSDGPPDMERTLLVGPGFFWVPTKSVKLVVKVTEVLVLSSGGWLVDSGDVFETRQTMRT